MKLIVTLLFAFTMSMGASAQEVFNQVVNTNKLIIEDPRADGLTLNIAQFKYTSMQYLCNMAIKVNGGGVDASFLDRQAYAMNQFVTNYLGELTLEKNSEKQAKIMKRYWQASAKNPLFGDKDTETTRAFANDINCFTPFSLDTNWELALKASKENKK